MLNNFEHPLFLLLTLLLIGVMIFRRSKYFLRHAYLKIIVDAKGKNMGGKIFNILPIFLKWLSWLLLILAAADYSLGYTESYQKNIIHQYVLINDGSGSMVNDSEKNGVGHKLKALLGGNDIFLKTLEDLKRPDGDRDWVAAAIFSNDTFIVSYFTEDYDFIRKKLNKVDWRLSPLNRGTEIDKAIWSGVKMILKKNADSQGIFYTEDELMNLELRTKGLGTQFDFKNAPDLEIKTEKIKKEIKGSALIIFTDGDIIFEGNQFRKSVAKLLLLCKKLDIRVYLISVDQIGPDLRKYIKETGGDSLILGGIDKDKIIKAYLNVVNREAGEYTIVDKRQQKSYAEWLATASLALLVISIVLRNIIRRSLTEI